MSDINDFGFTAVDQDELKTKTGESAGIGDEVAEQLKAVAASSAGQANSAQIEALDSKVDLLQKLVSNALGELDDQIGPWVADSEGNILYNLDEGKIIWNGYSFSPLNDINSARDYANHPTTFVSWYGAKRFAEFFNFRLPTEEEWEKAARADNGWDYPWGNYVDSLGLITNANYLDSGDEYEPESEFDTGTTPVAYHWYISYGGLYDMAGNVWEWVTREEDLYVSERMYRGGSWKSPKQDLRCWINNRFLEPHMMGNHIGFRCVK